MTPLQIFGLGSVMVIALAKKFTNKGDAGHKKVKGCSTPRKILPKPVVKPPAPADTPDDSDLDRAAPPATETT